MKLNVHALSFSRLTGTPKTHFVRFGEPLWRQLPPGGSLLGDVASNNKQFAKSQFVALSHDLRHKFGVCGGDLYIGVGDS